MILFFQLTITRQLMKKLSLKTFSVVEVAPLPTPQ
jgi:hypothetical protein